MKRCAIYARPTRDLESTFGVAEDAGRGQKISRASRSTTSVSTTCVAAEAMRVYASVANPSLNGQEV